MSPRREGIKGWIIQALPWRSSGEDSMLPLQGTQVPSLVQGMFAYGQKKQKREGRHNLCFKKLRQE